MVSSIHAILDVVAGNATKVYREFDFTLTRHNIRKLYHQVLMKIYPSQTRQAFQLVKQFYSLLMRRQFGLCLYGSYL
jgi:hypothetical protein